jgi:16S rRNA (uracil1498-N3)-methyltransferase
MTRRYFVDSPISGSQATLTGIEAHHAAHVMRCAPGEEVVLFDGRGGEYLAKIERVARSAVELAVLSHQAIERELAAPLVIGASLPKGERQRWLIEKLTELGVTSFVPLVSARAVAQPTGSALARLRRTVIESSKQCGRNRLMKIEPPSDWAAFVAAASARACRLVAHAESAVTLDAHARRCREQLPDGGAVVAVGPEGGLSDDEVSQARAAGWTAVCLGPRVLRVETAAIVLVSCLAPAMHSA